MSFSNIIVALDQMSSEEVEAFLSQPENSLEYVKIGLEMYLKYGPDFVKYIGAKFNKKIFLDLKLHDIPVTVEKAVKSLEGLPIHFLTLHIGGGKEMLKAALSQAKASLPECKILGVSFLTSLSEVDLNSIYGITDSNIAFLRLFEIAKNSQIDGVVCSPHEIKLLKSHAPELLAVTPGIRFQDEIDQSKTQDQKRIATPQEALNNGADFLVIGRSLTKSAKLIDRLKQLNQT